MMTQTHLLAASALLTRPGHGYRNIAVIFGALLPDISIFILFFWARGVVGISEAELWSVTYWSEPWQTLSAVSHSFPLFLLLAALAYYFKSQLLFIIAAAALLHIALDFPVHADDAHKHFWPLTDWRFFSPLSYWDEKYFAHLVRPIEILISFTCLIVLWRRFEVNHVRAVLGLIMISYVMVIGYCSVMLS